MARTLAYLLTMACGAFPALAVFAALAPWRRRRLRERGLVSALPREGALALFGMFCGGMAMVTLTPRWVVWSLVDWFHGSGWNGAGDPFFQAGTVNFIPLRTLRFDPYMLAGNIILFVPAGFAAALLWRGFDWRRTLAAGLCATGLIESWQLCVGRAFDIDDILLNTLGVFCGYGLWRLTRRLDPGFAEKFHVRMSEESADECDD